MQLTGFTPSAAAADWRLSRSPRVRPSAVIPPTFRKSRRFMPAQLRERLSKLMYMSVVEDELRRVDQGPEDVLGGGAAVSAGALIGGECGTALAEGRRTAVGEQVEL